jgi:hypothetical protein
LAAAMILQPSLRAEIDLQDVLGASFTIGDIIVGQTTLTPAYAVETWYHYSREDSYSTLKRVKRARVTGAHFYYTKTQTPSAVTESTAAFSVDTVNRITRHCEYDYGNFVVKTALVEYHTEFVWMQKVEQTGMIVDEGPWTVWLKTSGAKVGGCDPRTPVSTYFWASASIGKSGGQVVILGNPNCTLDYPFYLAGDFYK